MFTLHVLSNHSSPLTDLNISRNPGTLARHDFFASISRKNYLNSLSFQLRFLPTGSKTGFVQSDLIAKPLPGKTFLPQAHCLWISCSLPLRSLPSRISQQKLRHHAFNLLNLKPKGFEVLHFFVNGLLILYQLLCPLFFPTRFVEDRLG
jgi:hypothetical protein